MPNNTQGLIGNAHNIVAQLLVNSDLTPPMNFSPYNYKHKQLHNVFHGDHGMVTSYSACYRIH